MDTSGRFQLDIRDLDGDEMSRCWQLDDSFFSVLDEEDIKHGKLTATLRVKKKAASYQLDIHATGTIEIPCDRCLEPMTQPIEADDTIEVRLGDTFEDDGERITLPEDQPVLDVSWNQYLVSDADPSRDDSEGGSSDTEQPADSRWDALKALLDK